MGERERERVLTDLFNEVINAMEVKLDLMKSGKVVTFDSVTLLIRGHQSLEALWGFYRRMNVSGFMEIWMYDKWKRAESMVDEGNRILKKAGG